MADVRELQSEEYTILRGASIKITVTCKCDTEVELEVTSNAPATGKCGICNREYEARPGIEVVQTSP